MRPHEKGGSGHFDHIEETAQLIRLHYNSQNKSLESLIFEGKVLKSLALNNDLPFGTLQKTKLQEIARVYQLSGLLNKSVSLDDFIDPMGLNKKLVTIGILAKRGERSTVERWSALKEYLNENFDMYKFEIIPLNFDSLEEHIKNGSIDFMLTNSMYYVQLENRYGVSRIATLKNSDLHSGGALTEYGSVIFTTKNRSNIEKIGDLKNLSFGAVHQKSFGGWVMTEELLLRHGIEQDDMDVKFFNTHDAVVHAVLKNKVQAGTVRTDTLERMSEEGLLDLNSIKIINPMKYDNFPYLVSTHLYPEWPFAKLKHTPEALSNQLLNHMLTIKPDSIEAKETRTAGWTIPVDYSHIHAVLKSLRLPPYDTYDFDIEDVIKKYSLWFYLLTALLAAAAARLFYTRRINRYLEHFNQTLERQVKERTHALEDANARLKKISQTDALTGISNRGHFMTMGVLYFNLAKRNGTPLQILSLDLDNFKNINDTYGHQAGDEVLKLFTQSIPELLRESDLFGRIGGEEFAICLQNTSLEGAGAFAERVRKKVENTDLYYSADQVIAFTVSIGIAQLQEEKSFQTLLKESDSALYTAKNSGRNCVVIYGEKKEREKE